MEHEEKCVTNPSSLKDVTMHPTNPPYTVYISDEEYKQRVRTIPFLEKWEEPKETGITYESIVRGIIHTFDYEYHSIASLGHLIETIESFPDQELGQYEKYITSLKATISGYGFKNKRLTDRMADEVLTILKGSLEADSPLEDLGTSTEERRSFTDTIGKIIRDYDTKYTTIRSLQGILEELQTLSADELYVNRDRYNAIRGVIISYGNKDSMNLLTSHQSSKLLRTLKGENDRALPRPSGASFVNTYHTPVTMSPPQKLPRDDMMYDMLCLLQASLISSSGSGMTMPIVDFLDTCEQVIECGSDTHEQIVKRIGAILKDCGWKMKSATTAGGFQTSPDKNKLVNSIQAIIDAYF